MQDELEALTKVLQNPIRPLAAIVGGAKVSTKLDLLGSLLAKVDTLIIGGGMANTLLAARGYSVGKSLCERDLQPTTREIMAKAKAKGRELVLPVDAVVAKTFAPNAPSRVIAVVEVVEVAEAAAELTAAGKIVTVAGGGDTGRGAQCGRCDRAVHLCLDRWRRLPRMAGGQAFAGRRGA